MNDAVRSYVAGGDPFLYPAAGDAKPPGGAKVCLLTKGGVCIIGTWPSNNTGNFILGWAPLPKRDKDKERQLGII